jgi:hypothetical protein
MKFKLATLVTIGMGVISIAVIFVSIWVSGVSTQNGANTTDIATLKECVRNQSLNTLEIKETVKDIRNDQLRRERKESK